MTDAEEPKWVPSSVAVAISLESHRLFGGAQPDIADDNRLKAALYRPVNKWFYDKPAPDLFDLAAAYCFGIATTHPFVDGNKRVAYLVAAAFLQRNGVTCAPQQRDIFTTIMGVADGSVGEEMLAGWFRNNAKL
ncbi:type II toxin-antitoxin system death-on-curing family toxin [Hoeflea poritis]|uniref:Type II toxin-antitoxin system death-on-curing family toxin n=1 Tax=Hoeflea poritis TaxID=2993659 RepID=A0ABT4VPM1_9HYPH|nr:type II toxin-antitoxin system death-on-curing family toxin [Hoeflea poritis]MDA4846644.1 type II toxin-antitoxin system death-on-curing family toxin [Hoeflea poritis]